MIDTYRYAIDPVCVSPSASCTEIADTMDVHSVGCVLVTEGDDLRGIITDRDIVCRVVAMDRDPEKTSAAEVMTPDPITADESESIEELLEQMAARGIRRIPLTQEGRLSGFVALEDVVVQLSSSLFNANRGILGGLDESRRNSRNRRRREAREEALHELRDQLLLAGEGAADRIRDGVRDLRERLDRLIPKQD